MRDEILQEMYDDDFFPDHLVDKIRDLLIDELMPKIIDGMHKEEILDIFDEITEKINEMQDDFYENESEIESAARDSIAEAVLAIIMELGLDIEVEEALRLREW